MNLLVLLCGIVDYRHPLPPIAVSADGHGVAVHAERVLSPFDESALELALKLRDARPDTRISVALFGPAAAEPLLRHAAGFRADAAVRIDSESVDAWDARLPAQALAQFVREQPAPFDLILIGREFGDTDDGSLPPALALALQRAFVGRVQEIECPPQAALRLLRETGDGSERITVDRPMVVSVTNDRRNRLRHPLMKNVMMAKRMRFDVWRPPALARGPEVLAVAAQESRRREGAGRIVDGAVEEKIDALVELIDAWRRAR